MLYINDYTNKSYYDLMISINEYNKSVEDKDKIYIIISKINNNDKFIKYIALKNYYYIYLETTDENICCELNNILTLPYKGEQRHSTQKYLLSIISNHDFCKKMTITKIFQHKKINDILI